MLLLHEVHEVKGAAEDDFEAAYRDEGGWMHRLGTTDDARLLWYANQAHGSGPSYTVVTVTAVADGAAWERLARQIQSGDLQGWMADVDRLRHDVTGSLCLPLPWSPMTTAGDVPTTPQDHELTLYMEDTMWPHEGLLDDYIERAGTHYTALLQRPEAMLTLEAGWQTALGNGLRQQVTLMQKVRDPVAILQLLKTEIPAERRAPGTWMHDALALRDRWTSRLLRTSHWSPRW